MEKTKNCENCTFKQVCDILIEAYLEEESKYKSSNNFYEAQTILNGLLIRIRDKICSRFANTIIPNPNPYPKPYYPYPYPYYLYYPCKITYSLDSQTIGSSEKKQTPAEYYVSTKTDGSE